MNLVNKYELEQARKQWEDLLKQMEQNKRETNGAIREQGWTTWKNDLAADEANTKDTEFDEIKRQIEEDGENLAN